MSKNKNKLRRTLALTASVAIMGTSIPFNVLAESVYNDQNDKNIIVNNDNNLKDKLELSSDTEKEALKANESDIMPEAKFDKDMNIDDPATYDYAGYIIKHYNPTNEKFMKERNDFMYEIDNTLEDNTEDANKKQISKNVMVSKGKDLSPKFDEYIAELEKK